MGPDHLKKGQQMTTTETKTLEQFIKEEGIGARFEKTDRNPFMGEKDPLLSDWAKDATHYRVTLYSVKDDHSQQFVTHYSTGSAITETPTVSDVLDSLASDASTVEDCSSFEEWAGEFGYDTDSRSAEATYKAVLRNTQELRDMLETEEAFETLLYSVERL